MTELNSEGLEKAKEAIARSYVTYPDGSARTHISDWFDLDAQDAVDFGVMTEPKWHGHSDVRSDQQNAYIATVLGYGPLQVAISAYLSALPPVDGLEVVAEVEGLLDAYWGLAFMEGREGRDTDTPEDAAQKTRSAISSRLVTLSQAYSVIAGLKEANEALMRERTSLIDTKREQIERLTKERDEAVDNGHDWFNVSQDRMERISSLEEQNKRLREALACLVVEKQSESDNAMEWEGSGTYDHATDELGNTYTIEEVGSIDDSWSLSMTFANGEYNHLGWYDAKSEAHYEAEETRSRLAAQGAEKGKPND